MFSFKSGCSFVLILSIFQPYLASPVIELENTQLEEFPLTKTWCDPVLGCLKITKDWYSEYRPINVLPDKREKINTRFYLHTREQPNTEIDYTVNADDLTSLLQSTFDVSKPTKLIVHGFVNSGDTKWLRTMASSFLAYGDYNVLRVDWGGGARPMYAQATANTRVVGLEIGHLINTLIQNITLDPSKVHCVGHSLGAHTCGYGGEQVMGMGRITGLDPAGPYFTGTADFVHLDPSDALFVDNIHTDADSIFMLGYGTEEPMGNVDVYPNSGHDQPGCGPVSVAIETITESMLQGDDTIVACSHTRAIEYFIETLQEPTHCKWVSHGCNNYNSYEDGNCFKCLDDNTDCTYLGIKGDDYVDKSRLKSTFYIDTNNKSPYCIQNYDVSILTSYPHNAEPYVIGRLYIWLYGDTGESIEKKQITGDHERIDHGQISRTLFISGIDVGHIVLVELKWVYDDEVYNPSTYCVPPFCNRSLYIKSVEVSPISHYPESERLDYVATACSSGGSTTEIKSGATMAFRPSPACTPID